jgi:hypothetical protein
MAQRGGFTVSYDEALRRLVDTEGLLECWFEIEDVTQIVKVPRERLLAELEKAGKTNAIEESGFVAQRQDMGLHIRIKDNQRGLEGWLFLPTKPECRMTDEQLLARENDQAQKRLAELQERARAEKQYAEQVAREKKYN